MKIYNRTTILVFSISAFMVNGCVSKQELRISSPQSEVRLPSTVIKIPKIVQSREHWSNVKPLVLKKREKSRVNCVNCYAAPIAYSKSPLVSKRSFPKRVEKPLNASYNSSPIDYSKPPEAFRSALKNSNSKYKMSNIKHYGSYSYREKSSDIVAQSEKYKSENNNKLILSSIATINSTDNTFNSDLSIQVGAFRQYSGAKRYLRRYSALSSKYRTTIKTGQKENQPIYRVQIEGFKSKREAKRFMNSYSIEDAFLVRR